MTTDVGVLSFCSMYDTSSEMTFVELLSERYEREMNDEPRYGYLTTYGQNELRFQDLKLVS